MPVKKILDYNIIAMVGASDNPARPSHRVFNYLTGCGYQVIPVNPTISQVSGIKCYASLSDVPGKIEVVDIFRRSEDVPPVVDEAIKIGAKAVWMQEGIIHEAAAKKAEEAGLLVVMDKCMLKEHIRLSQEKAKP